MTEQPVIHWFRRDLRLTDNTALHEALKTQKPVITTFCFDDGILRSEYVGAPRVTFMLKALDDLQTRLWNVGGRLVILRGNPQTAIPRLIDETNAQALYINNDYTPYAKKRDDAIEAQVSVPVYRFHDALIMEPGSVMTNKGDPYSVYTPFKNKWRDNRPSSATHVQTDCPGDFYRVQEVTSTDLPTLAELNLGQTFDVPTAGEEHAQKRLDDFTNAAIYEYEEGRNELTINPFGEGEPGTSQLSPYFRLGILSPRQALTAARNAYMDASRDSARESVDAWVDELIWREFYMHVMAHYPYVYTSNYKDTYDDLEWNNDPEGLQRWKDGETGYPIIDAAMRQLKSVGWMPNRARMFVASFLTKDLLIHWQHGEAHFMQYLIDGDPAANNGGWQWAAGTGTDAQPYFRIFNPVSQSTKWDPDGDYIRHWVPELANLDKKSIHKPWTLKNSPADYPARIVDHKQARERTLAAFKRARGDNK